MNSVFVFGRNSNNELGITGDSKSPRKVTRLNNEQVIQIAAPYQMSYFLTNTNKVIEFGKNAGRTQVTHQIRGENIVSISAGTYHCLMLCESGNAYGIRENKNGQLGLGNTISQGKPTLIRFFQNKNFKVKQICGNYYNSYFLCTNNRLYGCGMTERLGTSTGGQNTHTPVQLFVNVKKVYSGPEAGGYFFTTNDNKLYAGGKNFSGSLGINNSNVGPHRPTELREWASQEIIDIAFGFTSSILINSIGKAYSCGSADNNGLGGSSNQLTFRLIPQLASFQFKQCSIGQDQSILCTNDGRLYIWGGSNSYGQLGSGNLTITKAPRELVIQGLRGNSSISLCCGLYSTYIYTLPNDSLVNDFKKLLERKELTDLEIWGNPVHSLLIQARTSTNPSVVKRVLEQNFTRQDTTLFLNYVYMHSISNLNRLKTITRKFNLPNPEKRTLRNDLLLLYRHEQSKEFKIMVEETQTIMVHKLILQTRSDLFRNMFLEVQDKSNLINDYSGRCADSIQKLVKFLYTDVVELNQNDDPSFVFEELEDVEDYYQLSQGCSMAKELLKISGLIKN
ncbi:hypothetical protein M0812_08824 [Anaeramoeba flamelloides]|uniref:BTB domain-containing protein n=1 Tax=Anaeramoeba flamelloides TaxID=1746091 RepID=A0AAV8A0C1_9EUKA|nr:hypothetical protein M0812_08824 [Anaeramoeba flamelloides]